VSRSYTGVAFGIAGLLLALSQLVLSQDLTRENRLWRRVGNSSILLNLPSPASGSVSAVWFSSDQQIYARLPDGALWTTTDFETWRPVGEAAPRFVQRSVEAPSHPDSSIAVIRAAARDDRILYAGGSQVWRSEDGGRHWRNLTGLRSGSLLGGAVADLAVDPADVDRVVAATATGVWMTVDGGVTWAGLNDGLPNLRIRRIFSGAQGSTGARVTAEAAGSVVELEWQPGQRSGWTLAAADPQLEQERRLSALASNRVGETVTAAAAGEAIYAGTPTGRLWASLDAGLTWRSFEPASSEASPSPGPAGRIVQIWTDPSDSRFALAAATGVNGRGPRLLRTLNGGVYWDDLTGDLPVAEVRGVTADRETGAVYLATSEGLYWALEDLRAPAPAAAWSVLSTGLPINDIRAVALNRAATHVLAAVEGYGLYAAPAPHRTRRPVLAHSADYGIRPAAPGALLSVVGARVASASANSSSATALPTPVLSADDTESQIQLPFEVAGDRVRLDAAGPNGRWSFGLSLQPASPAILIDREGSPFVLDADTGSQSDAMHPLRAGMRIQILASGLGRVTPDWPTGLPAPLDAPPRVIVAVRVWLGAVPLEVKSATLAPGYIGYYLIEAQLPSLLDAGAADLWIDAAGNMSNHVRVYVEE
jgi:uncharacterized protein (TIGR03437 family)